uniref:Uncharacterized protein n=1 Tax=Arundo donax TaxID=35708 RepID=A0A0A9F7T9_ARUDO
MMAHRQLWVS